jgi:hypothetical protein
MPTFDFAGALRCFFCDASPCPTRKMQMFALVRYFQEQNTPIKGMLLNIFSGIIFL